MWLANKQRVRKIQHPLTHSAPYRACWISAPFGGAEFTTLQSLLKMLLETKNSPLSSTKGGWSQFSSLQRVLNSFLKWAKGWNYKKVQVSIVQVKGKQLYFVNLLVFAYDAWKWRKWTYYKNVYLWCLFDCPL